MKNEIKHRFKKGDRVQVQSMFYRGVGIVSSTYYNSDGRYRIDVNYGLNGGNAGDIFSEGNVKLIESPADIFKEMLNHSEM